MALSRKQRTVRWNWRVSTLTYFRSRRIWEDLVVNSKRKLFPLNFLANLQLICFSLVPIHSGHNHYVPKLTGRHLLAFGKKKQQVVTLRTEDRVTSTQVRFRLKQKRSPSDERCNAASVHQWSILKTHITWPYTGHARAGKNRKQIVCRKHQNNDWYLPLVATRRTGMELIVPENRYNFFRGVTTHERTRIQKANIGVCVSV